MGYLNLDTLEEIMWFLLIYIIFLVIMTLFLKLAIGFFKKSKNKEFGKVFVTSFIITIVYVIVFLFPLGWISWIIVLVVAWILISVRHKTGFIAAIVITVIAFVLFIVITFLIGLLIGITIIVLSP